MKISDMLVPIKGGGYGKSDKYTEIKQNHLNNFMRNHASLVGDLMDTSPNCGRYHYFDCYAGPALDDDFALVGPSSRMGSPLIASNALYSLQVPYTAYLCESNRSRFMRLCECAAVPRLSAASSFDDVHKYRTLSYPQAAIDFSTPREVLAQVPRGEWRISRASCEEYMPQAAQHALRFAKGSRVFGLVYVDPNGIPPFDLMASMADTLPDVDFLLNFTATATKRVKDFRLKNDWDLESFARSFGRENCFIRQPYGSWQWTMLLLTNRRHMPPFRHTLTPTRVDFAHIDTPTGKEWLEKACYTRLELQWRKDAARYASQEVAS